MVVADDRTVHVFCFTGDTSGVFSAWTFGDIYSLLSADGYRTICIGRNAEASTAVLGSPEYFWLTNITTSAQGTLGGHYLARRYTGTGT